MKIAVFLLGALVASAALAQSFPVSGKPVRIVVPFPPGGQTDIEARAIAYRMSESLGSSVIVENKPGASTAIGARDVMAAAPDGHTLLYTIAVHVQLPHLYRAPPWDALRDFTPIATGTRAATVLTAHVSAPYNTVPELVAYAKANPGKLNIGTINVGSTQHLSAEMFRSMAGVDATVVPFKGSPAVITALRANDVQVAFEMLAPVIPQAKSGAVRILAVTSEKRHPSLPDVPTVAESGVPGYAASSWNAIAAPAKTPPAIVERLQQETARVLALPEVRDKLAAAGVTARASTPDELKRLLVSDVAKWRRVIEQAKIEKQ
jgi:tripartite-type tricarboxylate transporter receptor subunit TctC